MAERKVFISVDGSGPANCAFKWYLTELCRDGDTVYVVHMQEYDLGNFLPGAAVDVEAITQKAKAENEKIETLMNSYMDQLRPLKVKAFTKVLSGSEKPGERLVKEAEDLQVTMIIMGSRGLGKVRRTLLGSVSEYVMHHSPAHCSVTIVRES